MNSSREWGDNPEQVSASGDPEFFRRFVRAIIVLLAVIALAAAAWAGWSRLRSRTSESILDQSRSLVRQAAANPATSVDRMRNAERLLRDYLARLGANQDAARLLLCASLTLRSLYDYNQRISDAQEIEGLLNMIRPAACPLDDLLMSMDVFIHAGKLAQADWLAGAALRKAEGTAEEPRVLRLAANLRYDLGQEKEVLELCERLAELQPRDPEPWRRMAMVYEDGGYDEKMIESLRKVIELDETGAAGERLKLVNALITIGQRAEAKREFDLLAGQAPELVAQHPMTEARLLLLAGESGAATAIIERVLAADPEDTEAMLLQSQLQLSGQHLQEAADILERLLELDPMNFQAHYALGQAYARLGERDRAEHHLAMHRQILDTRVKIHTLERRAGRNPHDDEARTELIRLYETLGMTEHADFWRRAARSSGYDEASQR